jgi:hypothetical protein
MRPNPALDQILLTVVVSVLGFLTMIANWSNSIILDREGRQCGTFEHRWQANTHIARLRRTK